MTKFLGVLTKIQFNDFFSELDRKLVSEGFTNRFTTFFTERDIQLTKRDHLTNELISISFQEILDQNAIRLLLSNNLFRDFANIEEIVGRVIVEHTSANPISKLHLGRFRGSLIGDTYVRIIRECGYFSQSLYFINDLTINVAQGVYGYIHTRQFDRYANVSKEMENNSTLELEVRNIRDQMENNSSDTARVREEFVNFWTNDHFNSLEIFDIRFDQKFSDSQVISLPTVVSKLDEMGALLDHQGNYIYLMKDNSKKYLIHDFKPSYLLKDLFFMNHFKTTPPNPSFIISVIGQDHMDYVRIREELNQDLNFYIPLISINYGFLNINTTDKLSSRQNTATSFTLSYFFETQLSRYPSLSPGFISNLIKSAILSKPINHVINLATLDLLEYKSIFQLFAKINKLRSRIPVEIFLSLNLETNYHNPELIWNIYLLSRSWIQTLSTGSLEKILQQTYRFVKYANRYFSENKIINENNEINKNNLLGIELIYSIISNTLRLYGLDSNVSFTR